MDQADLNLAQPRDAGRDNWVDRFAPIVLRPYLRLMRADRPIGTWLLLLPCWAGLLLGLTQLGPGTLPSVHLFSGIVLGYVVLFAIGAFVMRGAGCTYNDITDRDFDARVERTAQRPIPAGQISVKGAALFLIAQALVGLVVLSQFNRFTILLGLASLILVAIYPFMKRITYWPQLWLGLTFNWGALVGYSAITGTLSPAAFALYGAGIFWTLGYDTIYAHQDKDDDALIGVKSSALALGEKTPFWLTIFYGLTILSLLVMSVVAHFHPLSITMLAAPTLHFLWQRRRLDINDGHNCLRLFKSNRDAGFLLLLPMLSENLLRLISP